MKKYFIFSIFATSFFHAQTLGETLDNLGKNIDINVYLKTSYEGSDKEDFNNGFKINEARTEIMGNLHERLLYRTRWRMNRQTLLSSVSNSTSSMDYAYITYLLGKEKEYALTIGKQRNNSRGWEFTDNPVYEHQFSHYISQQPNPFPVGVELSYTINPKHIIYLQGFNPSALSFDELHKNTQYAQEDLKKSTFPLGINLTWKGIFLNNTFKTVYNIGTSQIAKGQQDFQISLGNKLSVDKLDLSLDMHHTSAKVDYTHVLSPFVNAYYRSFSPDYIPVFARNIQFQSAVVRANYSLSPQWFINCKATVEQIQSKENPNLEKHAVTKTMGQVAIEYKPFINQNFKIFGYYAHFQNHFSSALQNTNPNTNHKIVAVGMLWLVNAL